MSVHIDFAVKKDCWNLYETSGEICVGCGCCAEDKGKRYAARIQVLKREIQYFSEFDQWSNVDAFRTMQKKNIALTLKQSRRQLAYYEKKLKDMNEQEK